MSAPSPDAHPQKFSNDMRTRLLDAVRNFAGRLPPSIGNPLADRVGDAVYTFASKSRRYAISNMAHVLGANTPRKRLKKTVRGVFHNVMRNYYDLSRASAMRDEDIDRLVNFDEEGWQRVLAVHNSGQGVLLVTAHFGSFDIMTHVLTRHGKSITSLMARIKPLWLSDFIIELRAARGLQFLVVEDEDSGGNSGTNVGALRGAIETLRSGGILGVIADRNMEAQGVRIPFFGEETVVAAGVAKMALRTRSAIVPTFCYRLPGNRYSITFEEPLQPQGSSGNPEDVKALLLKLFARFEYHIGRYPEQWVLLQPVWRHSSPAAHAEGS